MVAIWRTISPHALQAGFAIATMTGCGAAERDNTSIPANSACLEQGDPPILFLDSHGDSLKKQAVASALFSDLHRLKQMNASLLCGLKRLEVRGDVEFAAVEDPAHAAAHYDPVAETIRIHRYSRSTLYHEIAHSVGYHHYFSSIVNDVLSQSWNSEGENICGANRCYISHNAKTNRDEDWAETFEHVFLDPFGVAAASTFDLLDESGRPLLLKVYHTFRMLPMEMRSYARIDFGDQRQLPASDARIVDGSTVFLLNKRDKSFMQYDLEGRGEVQPANESGKYIMPADIVSSDLFSHRHYLGRKRGEDILFYGREQIFEPYNIAHVSQLAFLNLGGLPTHAGQRLRAEGLIGELMATDAGYAFFVYDDNVITLRSYELTDYRVTDKMTWHIHHDFRPLHIMPLAGSDDKYFVIGDRKSSVESPVDSDPRNLQALILSSDPNQPEKQLEWGDIVPIDNIMLRDITAPIQVGQLILFQSTHHNTLGLPDKSIGFFAYDLEAGRFKMVIANEIKNTPPVLYDPPDSIRELQVVKDGKQGLHLLVTLANRTSIEVPMTLVFD